MGHRWPGAVAVLVLAGLLWTGCGGSSQSASDTTELPGPSGVRGVVLMGASGRAVLGSGAGGTALAGVTLALVNVIDEVVASGSTGSDGSFALTDDRGSCVVTLRIDDPAGTTEIPLTLTPGATLDLRAQSPIDRAAAQALVMDGVGEDALVALAQQPFPAGTRVYPQFGGAEGDGPFESDVHTVGTGGEWFALIDRQTFAPFSHQVEYVYVNADSGAVTRETQFWLPVVNGRFLWAYHGGLTRFDPATELPLHSLGGNYPDDAGFAPRADLVQVPDAPDPDGPDERFRQATAEASKLLRQTDSRDDFYAMVFCGTPEPEFVLGAMRMTEWLQSQGVPDNNVESAYFVGTNITSYSPTFAGLLAAVDGNQDAGLQVRLYNAAKLGRLEEKIRAKREAGKSPTLFLYATSHSAPGGRFVVVDNLASMAIRYFRAGGLPVARLRIDEILPVQNTVACKVQIVLDTCFAGAHLQRYYSLFQQTRHEFDIYTASGTGKSTGVSFWRELKKFLSVGDGETGSAQDAGLYFTFQWVQNATIDPDGSVRPGDTFTGNRRGFKNPLTETDSRSDNDRKSISLGNRGQCPPMDTSGGGDTGGGDTGGDGTGGDGTGGSDGTGGDGIGDGDGDNTVPGINVIVD